MPQWPPFPQGSAGTTARLLPTLCPAWSVPAFPEGITAALWSVFSIRIVSCLFFGEVRGYFKLQSKSVLYRCPLSVPWDFWESHGTQIWVIQWWGCLLHEVANTSALQMVCERSDVFASCCAMARAFPIFSRRSASSRRTEKKHVTVEFVIVGQDANPLEAAELEVL